MGFRNQEERVAVLVKPEEIRMQRRLPSHRDKDLTYFKLDFLTFEVLDTSSKPAQQKERLFRNILSLAEFRLLWFTVQGINIPIN